MLRILSVAKRRIFMLRNALLASAALFIAACSPATVSAGPKEKNAVPFDILNVATFNEPWAMTFVRGTPFALITERKGRLLIWREDGLVREVSGLPKVAYGGQGGLGDIILNGHENANGEFEIALSWVEQGRGGFGAAVALAFVDMSAESPSLKSLRIVWKQTPKVDGRGHFGHRLAFSPDGKYLFISSGERQKFDPAQDMNSNLGKIIRLKSDGSVPADNPFYDAAKPVQSQIWSLGHRNPLGLTFDNKGQLWNSEMGPQGGDEVNLVKRAANYGYPKASNGSHYGGGDIPDHKSGDGYEAPAAWWNPSISPGSLAYYGGNLFPKWKNSLFVGALGGEALIRLQLDGGKATKADQWPMGARIREVETAPDGSVWLLEDGGKGRLLKLTPKKRP
jgi:aldose sugar dehydrogenase